MTNLTTLAAAGADRNFRFDLPGTVPDLLFCDGKCPNSKELDTNNGGGKWMYDQTADKFGFDPKTARNMPDQDAKIMARLGKTIDQLIANAKSGGASSLASQHSDFRSALTQITRTEESAITAKLTEQHLATLAALPGAATLSDPAVRGAVHVFVSAEQRLLTAAAPPLGQAAKAGSALGVLATVALAEALAPDVPLGPQAKPVDDSLADDASKRAALNTMAAALDANKDDKLECKEIGQFVPDSGYVGYSNNVKAYQDFISGKPGMDFKLYKPDGTSIKFDGCTDTSTGALLLEAKAKYGEVLTGEWSAAPVKIANQGFEQDKAATTIGVRNEWHVQVAAEADIIRDILNDTAKVQTPVIHTDLPIVK